LQIPFEVYDLKNSMNDNISKAQKYVLKPSSKSIWFSSFSLFELDATKMSF
jgi:hypothetical protein